MPSSQPSTLLVEDRVRHERVPVTVDPGTTVGRFVHRYAREHGLPSRTLDGEEIRYRLMDADGTELSDPDAELDRSGDRVVLSSERGRSTWQRLSGLVTALETELGTTYRADATAALDGRLEAVREQLTTEAGRRVRGVGSGLDRRTRRRLRALTAELGLTDAFPTQMEDITVLVRRSGPLASSASRFVAPLLAVTTAAVGGGVVADQLIDVPTATEIADEVAGQVDGMLDEEPAAVATPVLDVDALADEIAVRLSIADRLTTDDLAVLLAGLADALQEADPATSPILGGITAEPRTQVTAAGGSLWTIASTFRDQLATEAAAPGGDEEDLGCDVPPTFDEPIGTYVLRVWAANLDAVGADPDALETGTTLRMPCPR